MQTDSKSTARKLKIITRVMRTYAIQGSVSDDRAVIAALSDRNILASHRIRLDTQALREEVDLFVARTKNVLVTSCYLPIDLASNRLMANQSYHDIAYWFPGARPKIVGADFELVSDPVVIKGPHVLIGGWRRRSDGAER